MPSSCSFSFSSLFHLPSASSIFFSPYYTNAPCTNFVFPIFLPLFSLVLCCGFARQIPYFFSLLLLLIRLFRCLSRLCSRFVSMCLHGVRITLSFSSLFPFWEGDPARDEGPGASGVGRRAEERRREGPFSEGARRRRPRNSREVRARDGLGQWRVCLALSSLFLGGAACRNCLPYSPCHEQAGWLSSLVLDYFIFLVIFLLLFFYICLFFGGGAVSRAWLRRVGSSSLVPGVFKVRRAFYLFNYSFIYSFLSFALSSAHSS